MVAKIASAAHDYAVTADSFVLASMHCPNPPGGEECHKRAFEGSPSPFRAKKHQPTSSWYNRSASTKSKRPVYECAPRSDFKSPLQVGNTSRKANPGVVGPRAGRAPKT